VSGVHDYGIGTSNGFVAIGTICKKSSTDTGI